MQFPRVQDGAEIAPSAPLCGPVTIEKVNEFPAGSLPERVMVLAVSSAVVTDWLLAVGA